MTLAAAVAFAAGAVDAAAQPTPDVSVVLGFQRGTSRSSLGGLSRPKQLDDQDYQGDRSAERASCSQDRCRYLCASQPSQHSCSDAY